MRTPAPLAALLLLGPLLAGCSDGGDGGRTPLPPEWRGRDLREPGWSNQTLEGGWTVAFEYHWPAGKRVAWDWVVVAPVFETQPVRTVYAHFQLVRMEGSTARPIVAEDGDQGAGERTIVQTGTHQLDWMNEWTEPVTIAVKVPEGAQRILYPPGEGPGCLVTGRTTNSCLAWPAGLPPPPTSA